MSQRKCSHLIEFMNVCSCDARALGDSARTYSLSKMSFDIHTLAEVLLFFSL